MRYKYYKTMRYLLMGLLFCTVLSSSWAWSSTDRVEAIQKLQAEGALTVRALYAWDYLPPEFMNLALTLRSRGVDLLGADTAAVQALAQQARLEWGQILAELSGGEPSSQQKSRSGFLHSHIAQLEALAAYMLAFDPSLAHAEQATEQPPVVNQDMVLRVMELLMALGSIEVYDDQQHILLPGGARLILQGQPTTYVRADGQQAVRLPLSLLLPDELLLVDFGEVEVQMWPTAAERWGFTVVLPPQLQVQEPDSGIPVAVVEMAQNTIQGEWISDAQVLALLDMQLGGIDLRFLDDDIVQFPEDPYRLRVDEMQFLVQDAVENPDEPTVILAAQGIRLETFDGEALVQLGALSLTSAQDLDPPLTADWENPERLMEQLSITQGASWFALMLEDLQVINDLENPQSTSLLSRAEFRGFIDIAAGVINTLELTQSVHGLTFDVGFMEPEILTMDGLVWAIRLRRFALLDALQLVMQAQAQLTNPLELLDSARNLLGDIEFDMALSGVSRGVVIEQETVNQFAIDRLTLKAILADLDTPALSVGLSYDHAGFSVNTPWDDDDQAMPIPHSSTVDLALNRVPLVELLLSLAMEANPEQLVALVQTHASQLNISKLELQTADGGMNLNATAEGEGDRVVLRAEVVIHNLDQLVQSIASVAPDAEERQKVEAAAAMLRLLGQQETGAEGTMDYRFVIEADSLGTLLVNDKDIQPLLFGG